MDLETLREHIGAGPSDAVLEDLLAAAIEAIEDRYGPAGMSVREYLRPYGQWVKLGRRAESVESVRVGTDEPLEAADYEIWPDAGGRYLRRLSGDDPVAWTGWVEVEYTPLSDEASRDRVTVALVSLDLNRPAGLAGITVGPWSEQYSGADAYAKTRQQILDSMRSARPGTW